MEVIFFLKKFKKKSRNIKLREKRANFLNLIAF